MCLEHTYQPRFLLRERCREERRFVPLAPTHCPITRSNSRRFPSLFQQCVGINGLVCDRGDDDVGDGRSGRRQAAHLQDGSLLPERPVCKNPWRTRKSRIMLRFCLCIERSIIDARKLHANIPETGSDRSIIFFLGFGYHSREATHPAQAGRADQFSAVYLW
jgi:hypothetical protein